MFILLLFIFCIPSLLFSAEHIYLQIPKSMLPSRIHAKNGWSILSKQTVMTPHFKAMEHLPQERKNQELHQILAMAGGEKVYPELRKIIAAFIYIGADVPAIQRNQHYKGFKLLPDVTRKQDKLLLTLLFDNGANVHQKNECGITAIFYAQKVAIAQMLIEQGALHYLTVSQKRTLLGNCMRDTREANLVELYTNNSCKDIIMACDEFSWTLLMQLAIWPQKQIIKKAALLLDKLNQEQITELLRKKNNHNQTVFHMIEGTEEISSPENKKYLTAYYDYLIKRLIGTDIDKDNCSICLEPLKKNLILTHCTHIFHKACLSQWEKKECPLCCSKLL